MALLAGCTQPTAKPDPVPLYAQDQYVAGVVALHELHLADAEAAARAAVEQAPDFVEAQVLLAESLLKQSKSEEAVALLDVLVAGHPEAPTPALLRGMVHELNGDLPAAQELYRRARATYDIERLTREQAAQLAVVSYLASGRLAGFKVLDEAQARFPGDHELDVIRGQISEDQRAYFLQRAKAEAPATQDESNKE